MGSFVGADANGGNVTTITGITWPSVQSGDLAILAWVFVNTDTVTDPTSDTFSLVTQQDSQDCRCRVLYRICDGSESGDITGWSGTAQRQCATLFVVRGYTAISGFTVFAETTNGTSHDCPTITTSNGFGALTPANGDTTLVLAAERAGSTGTLTAPSGWSTRTGSQFAATGSGGTIVGVADDGLGDASTMPVNPGSWTGFTVSTDDALTITLALRPTATGVTGTVAVTQAANTSSASGILGYSGTLARTQAANTSTASGTVTGPVSGTAAPTQANQTATASGVLRYSGTAAVTQAANTATAAGVLRYSGTTAVTQAANTAAASGSVVGNDVAGSAAIVQANQTATAAGILQYSGTAAPTQANNTATASGVLRYTGTGATTQAADTAAASGLSFVPVFGTVAVTQASQTVSAAGEALGNIVFRPDAGTTSRPTTGTTTRPFAGITQRP